MHNAVNVEKGGADFLICVSNTMHKVLDDISDTIKIPFIHIVDPTAEAIKKAGLKKVGLLGTKATMESSFFKDRFKNKHNIELIIPNEEEQKIIDEIIFNELVKGIISEDSRRKYIEISKKMNQQGAQGLILGCTEIFLLLRQSDIPNLPMFNTTELHVKAAVKFALSSDS
ncbi:aspartate/glutamate racemase family protein [Halarcobacter anaerophilus]|uniref:aspartate/glutamate racemase family protein n=1 Tax=Halarcobacter anaerophilus TaxID=877500 RepID=UPI000A72A5CC|nr:amino acid racemase [Halarcobacter anaerophilus]